MHFFLIVYGFRWARCQFYISLACSSENDESRYLRRILWRGCRLGRANAQQNRDTRPSTLTTELGLKSPTQPMEGIHCTKTLPGNRPGRELRILRLEIQVVDLGQQAPRLFQLAVDECRVEVQLRRIVGDLCLPPGLHLALQTAHPFFDMLLVSMLL